ncbi:D-threo-aldose 1-dehydrogenase [Nonomuraea polychroma]|uniref:D-threo-aldose 1-dehydrogenase n=1 Tax=Nonomuraea polychroma TaxID=46176 RepID=A0A438MIQ8_9ACTN|nr:aldo/keto reductase [Nonomuraea polychroma]RVX45790.1 D-threo-aldose 1-dehydrogenase [Nonomuraea polychroma]
MTLDHVRPLGATGLLVSAISLGTSTLGDPAQPDGSPAPESVKLARTLLSAPYAVIDTSNNYAQGRSETALGQALAAYGLPAGRTIVSKTDADPETGRFDRDRVWRSFEETAARLGLERLPLLHLHDPYTITVEEAFARGGAVQGMIELREQGLAGAIGIAAGEIQLMTRYVTSGAFDVLLTHNRYTLVDRRAEELMTEAAARGMGIFNAAPFGGGLLAGRGTRYAYREASPELLDWVGRARELCHAYSIELAAAALHFSLRSPLIHSTVVGVGRPERITQLEELHRTTIPDDFWPALEALGTPPSTIDD